MKKLIFGLIVAVATAAIIVPLALAGGGNSDNAKACQKNGWQTLARAQDSTAGFNNQDECVSYAAHGGSLISKTDAGESTPTSTPGSENFASYAAGEKPATFSGGTIDSADYAAGDPVITGGWGGSILVAGPYFNGFDTGTHFLFTGIGVNKASLTFASAVTSVQVQAQSNHTVAPTNLTLTGYDANGKAVASATGVDAGFNSVQLTATSASANIKSFTIETDDPSVYGLGFSNIVWS